MSEQLSGQNSTFELPENVHRALLKGETIWHSQSPCHVSKKYPDGKWIAQVRREERGLLVKYPMKGFGTAQDALKYVKSLRPNAAGRVTAKRQGEPVVRGLYEYARAHHWKKLSERRKQGKESRWRLHIEPFWGSWALSEVTRRAAQEWLTDLEGKIAEGKAGTLGIPQLNEVRTDLGQLFDVAPDFDEGYGERRNPFHGLSFAEAPPRARVTIESSAFAPILDATFSLVKLNLATPWIAEMFATALLAGLREGEVIALMANRIDWDRKLITVDRALRMNAPDIDDKSGLPTGPLVRLALGLPKNNKTRIVPISDQLASILRPACERANCESARPYLWPGTKGGLREPTRFQKAFQTLRGNLNVLAKFERSRWSRLNDLVKELRADETRRLPAIFEQIDFRDTRNSFASYANEVGMPQATREAILGHAKGITNIVYTDLTSKALSGAQEALTNGWTWVRHVG